MLVLALMWCVPGAWGGGRMLPPDHDCGEALNLRGVSQAVDSGRVLLEVRQGRAHLLHS